MRTGRPSAVTLDAGNTLLYSDPPPQQVYARALSRHGRAVLAEEVGPVFADAWAEMQQRTPAGTDRYSSVPGGERAWWGAFLREVLGRLAHDADPETLLDELYAAFADVSMWRVYPEVPECLEALSDRGVALAIVSNWDRRLPEILSELGLARHFDAVLVSSVEGVEKPSEEIFHRAVARLGVASAAALHVGDSPLDDYHGARAAGLQAVLLDRAGRFAGAGYRRISSLEEVVEMVGG